MVPTGPVSLGAPVRSLGCGFLATCAATQAGEVWCWGDNADGSLGTIDGPSSQLPVKVPAPLPGGVERVLAGSSANAFCAVTTSRELWCWGTKLHTAGGFPTGTWIEPHRFDFSP
jgi:alpha-tubulin suppressor-like RCC1 family protein